MPPEPPWRLQKSKADLGDYFRRQLIGTVSFPSACDCSERFNDSLLQAAGTRIYLARGYRASGGFSLALLGFMRTLTFD